MKLKDLTGERFGRLTVIKRIENHYYPSGRHDIQYRCRCDCGNEVNVLGIHLRSGHTVSCGCFRKENTSKMWFKHGMTNERLYYTWKNMKARCYNKNHDDYNLYGGRGIKVSKKWKHDFSAFAEWALKHGYDDTLTIDRIDVNGNYKPSNCRFVTQKEQCNNTRRNIIIKYKGESHTIKEWSKILGIKYETMLSRFHKGWSIKKVFSKK